jgi:hypothetical protein
VIEGPLLGAAPSEPDADHGSRIPESDGWRRKSSPDELNGEF